MSFDEYMLMHRERQGILDDRQEGNYSGLRFEVQRRTLRVEICFCLFESPLWSTKMQALISESTLKLKRHS